MITFKGLFRIGKSTPCAVMMIYKRTDITNGAEFYICIPSKDASPEIWQQTLDVINLQFRDNISANNTLIWALMKLTS